LQWYSQIERSGVKLKKSALAGIGLSGLALKDSPLFGQIVNNEKDHHENSLEDINRDNVNPNNRFVASHNPVDLSYMDISVKETAGLNLIRPVTGGVPLAEGMVTKGSRFILLDKNYKSVPCQSHVLTRWKDGSARWVLINFQANPQANGTDQFRLKWESGARNPLHPTPLKLEREQRFLQDQETSDFLNNLVLYYGYQTVLTLNW